MATIAVDFDGTIVEHQYPEIGEERPFAIETLKMLIHDRHKVILWLRNPRLLHLFDTRGTPSSLRQRSSPSESIRWCFRLAEWQKFNKLAAEKRNLLYEKYYPSHLCRHSTGLFKYCRY